MKDVAKKHQLKIAKDTLKMSDVGAFIMGGMTKDEAREILFENSTCKSGITGCVNCNTDCHNGEKYEPDGNSCANRVFEGDDELYAYIDSQYH